MKKTQTHQLIFCILALFLRSGQICAKALSETPLQKEISNRLAQLDPKSEVGVSLFNLNTHTHPYQRNSNTLFPLASVSKLLTTGAALLQLGGEYKWSTQVYLDKNENLIIRGGGDPFFVTERLFLFATKISRILKAKKKTVLKGGLFSLHGFFDEIERASSRQMRSSSQPYNSSVSSLALNFNSASFEVFPNPRLDKPGVIFVVPPNSKIEVQNKTITSSKGSSFLKIKKMESKNGKEVFQIQGKIDKNSPPQTLYSWVDHPDLHFLNTLIEILNTEGIQFKKPARVLEISEAENLKESSLLLNFESLPSRDIFSSINKWSNNFMADCLFKTLGAIEFGEPGSFEKGAKAVTQILIQNGIPEDGFQIEMGSGLSEENQASPDTIAKLITLLFQKIKTMPEFLSSLAIPGGEGTLQTRLQSLVSQGGVRAKTGTLFKSVSISSIAGVTQNKSGDWIVFTILNQRKDGGSSSTIQKFKNLQDDLLAIIKKY